MRGIFPRQNTQNKTSGSADRNSPRHVLLKYKRRENAAVKRSGWFEELNSQTRCFTLFILRDSLGCIKRKTGRRRRRRRRKGWRIRRRNLLCQPCKTIWLLHSGYAEFFSFDSRHLCPELIPGASDGWINIWPTGYKADSRDVPQTAAGWHFWLVQHLSCWSVLGQDAESLPTLVAVLLTSKWRNLKQKKDNLLMNTLFYFYYI